MSEPTLFQINDSTANPAPLGLFGFGMTTVLLNLHNAGFFGMNTMILSMGLCYGGAAQVIAGVMEWKKKNTFGLTAFTSYGFFWLSLVALLLLPTFEPKFATLSVKRPEGVHGGVGLFTFGMFIGTFRLSVALQVVFGSLTLLFVLLAIGFLANASDAVLGDFTGYEGIFCGLSAFYAGIAQVLNEVYGKTVLPLGMCSRKK